MAVGPTIMKPVPRRILPAIVAAQLAGTSLWFAGNAIMPDLQRRAGLGIEAIGDMTTAVQLGFIAGTLVFSFFALVDRFSPRTIFLASALLGAACNAATYFAGGHLWPLLLLRFATGFFLAGIYPVGMKIASGWFDRDLGQALGFLVGALVLGTATPHLLGHDLPWESVMLFVSALAALGGLVMYWLVPDGPYSAGWRRLCSDRSCRHLPLAGFSRLGIRLFRPHVGTLCFLGLRAGLSCGTIGPADCRIQSLPVELPHHRRGSGRLRSWRASVTALRQRQNCVLAARSFGPVLPGIASRLLLAATRRNGGPHLLGHCCRR